MDLLIQIDENGSPLNHPYLRTNLQLAFPEGGFEGSNIPSGWLVFERVPEPEIGVYQKYDDSKGADNCDAWEHNGLEYQVVDGKVRDVWTVLDMTDAEKKAKQDAAKAEWDQAVADGTQLWVSWVFDEATCTYIAPVAYPDDGKDYNWNETNRAWDEITSTQNELS